MSRVLDREVATVSAKAIGAGLVGDSARIAIEYADGANGPTSMAGKFPAADATSRATAVSLKLYEKEVGFYRAVAPNIAIRTPEIYFAGHDAASGDFLLLMEDCGPAEQGDQLAGCSLEQAEHAVRQLAALHGPTYENQQLLSLPFLQPNAEARAFAAAGYPGASEKFCAFYEGKIEPELLSAIAQIGANSQSLLSGEVPTGPCVIHGDFRLDNLLFAIKGAAEPMVTLDWQTVALGDPLIDLGYFLGAGISSALRRPNEAALIASYQDELRAHGGPDLGDIRVSDGYARGALHGVTTAVFSAAFVEHNDRSEVIFQSMAEGAIELVLDIDAMRILES
ncbi:phosphotransferase [Altererythrobacter aquaemixtae]|uniref:Phosphotransferase n=1 Tax=Pontixanthobacter aquaemixtae TaxID=1958940 RepID=A0A844ZQV0_9SPHN|nr:phosphotransferase [Pontixanthobacter aquaemixtae]